jgi:hypothetical protein
LNAKIPPRRNGLAIIVHRIRKRPPRLLTECWARI